MEVFNRVIVLPIHHVFFNAWARLEYCGFPTMEILQRSRPSHRLSSRLPEFFREKFLEVFLEVLLEVLLEAFLEVFTTVNHDFVCFVL